MRYRIFKEAGHLALIVDVATDTNFMELAQEQAEIKSRHVDPLDPQGRRRLADEIFSQNFLGVVADLACARLLQTYYKQHNHAIAVARYDDVRTDNFLYPDQYDIRLQHGDLLAEVEVRSSVCYKMPAASMIKKWQILGWYASNTKGESEQVRAFYMRPLFHFSEWNTYKYKKDEGYALFRDGRLQLYIVGGADRKLLEEKGRDENGHELKQGDAVYRLIDIRDGLNIEDFLSATAKYFLPSGS